MNVVNLKDYLIAPTKLQIRKCAFAYGVFATDDIVKGEIMEEAPMTPTMTRSKQDVLDPILKSYLYILPCKCEGCEEHGRKYVLSMGNIQMYNHSEDPNAHFNWLSTKRIVQVVASKDISKEEQIFTCYGKGYKSFLQGIGEQQPEASNGAVFI